MSGPTQPAAAHGAHEEEASSERWLLTYADMVTLLLALFIVLWSISSVNISKFAALKSSLSQAFSGKVLQATRGSYGGTAILNPEGTQIQNIDPTSSTSPTAFPDPNTISQTIRRGDQREPGQDEIDNLRQVRREVTRRRASSGSRRRSTPRSTSAGS